MSRMSLHLNNRMVEVFTQAPVPLHMSEDEACRILLAHRRLVHALAERVRAFWGDWMPLPAKYRESFRRDYPDHPVMKAEALLAELGHPIE